MLPSASGANIMLDSPKFLLDENIPKSVKRWLESNGFPAEYAPRGVVNSKAFSLAKERESVIASRDTDFLNTGLFPPKESFGIVVFVIHPPRPEKLVKALSSLLAEVKELKGKLFVVDEEGFEVVE